jgi:proline iminopeptidase
MNAMTMHTSRRLAHDKLAALPGVRPIRRPVYCGGDDEFDVYYVRTGRKSAHPLVIIPGGPGAASIALYRALRRRAAVDGLDVIMVEHRGVGLSRRDDAGRDLPPEALSVDMVVDDTAAVLDEAGVDQAVVYGTSYGSYLAAGLGVRHPARIHTMVLDSPLLSADDIDDVRAQIRRVLWDGTQGHDGTAPGSADLAAKVRRLVTDGVLTPTTVLRAADIYGIAGPDVLRRQLDLLLAGHDWLWTAVGLGTRLLLERQTPYHHEPDLVERIAYRELNYGAVPDGGPLDPAVAFREIASGDVDFVAEPYDLISAMPGFSWPTAVIAGSRDLTTPPAVARRVTDLIPDSVLVEFPTAGHSILDTREHAALQIGKAACTGEIRQLPSRSAELDALPANMTVRLLVRGMAIAARAESVLPDAVPRAVRQATTS